MSHLKGHMPLSLTERRVVLIFMDLISVNISLFVYITARPFCSRNAERVLDHPGWFILLSIIWLVCAWSFDCYESRVMHKLSLSLRSALFSCLSSVGLFLIIPYITPSLAHRRWTLFVFPFSCYFFLALSRVIFRLLFRNKTLRRKVVVVGTGVSAEVVASVINKYGKGAYDLVGFIEDNLRLNSKMEIDSWSILGNIRDLQSIVRQHKITTIVVALNSNVDASVLELLINCLELGVEIVPMNVMYEQLTGRIPVYHVDNEWYVALPVNHALTKTLNRITKRLFDIFFASLGILIMLPLLPLFALAIYIDCPGPIFYTQERVGRGGRLFKLYKFRSMIPCAEQGRPVWACESDPRVTRVGRLLRKTHIDEFPQLINILKGDMSVVGPRPERPEFVEELAREIPFYRVRHAVKPGMAGWALVRYGYASSKEDTIEKLQYDLYYIKHQSLWFDLVILVKTVLDTLTLRGRA